MKIEPAELDGYAIMAIHDLVDGPTGLTETGKVCRDLLGHIAFLASERKWDRDAWKEYHATREARDTAEAEVARLNSVIAGAAMTRVTHAISPEWTADMDRMERTENASSYEADRAADPDLRDADEDPMAESRSEHRRETTTGGGS